jgi:meiotically up-regulated gene 157 (Mug157) protein
MTFLRDSGCQMDYLNMNTRDLTLWDMLRGLLKLKSSQSKS